MQRVIDFESLAGSDWYVVDDGVMGGRSSSSLRSGESGIAVFEGVLSLENNGGFASVRTVAFASTFETVADEWTTVELPLDSFQPTFRGYRPRRVAPLDPADVGQLGLMLTDKQEGSFRLEIDWIGYATAAGSDAR